MICKICKKEKCWYKIGICYYCKTAKEARESYNKLTEKEKKELGNKLININLQMIKRNK